MPYELIQDDEPVKNGKYELMDESPSRARSLISAPVKGAIKGATDIASMTDPFKAILGLNELNPHQKQAIEQTLPTQDNPIEKGLERGGRLAVTTLGGPESLAAKGLRTAAGATLGQVAEEAGAPEWAQNLSELLAFMSPKFSKKITPTKSQTEAVEFLRGKGLSDKEITPLLKTEKKIRSLGRLSKKGPKTETLTRGISEKLGEGYDLLKTEGKEKFLKGKDVLLFDDKLGESLEKISPSFARLIEKDVESLRNKGISQKNLIDFYQDINRVVKGQEGGKSVLNTIKPLVIQGLEKIDPKSAKDFSMLNQFYAKKAVLSKSLKPDVIDKWLKKGKVYGAVAGIATGNPYFLKGIIAEEVGSRIIREILINPRLQNLSNQMLKSISKNQVQTAAGAYKIFKDELKKHDLDAFKSLDSIEESEVD